MKDKIVQVVRRKVSHSPDLLARIYTQYSKTHPTPIYFKFAKLSLAERASKDQHFRRWLCSMDVEIVRRNKQYRLAFRTEQDEIMFLLRHL